MSLPPPPHVKTNSLHQFRHLIERGLINPTNEALPVGFRPSGVDSIVVLFILSVLLLVSVFVLASFENNRKALQLFRSVNQLDTESSVQATFVVPTHNSATTDPDTPSIELPTNIGLEDLKYEFNVLESQVPVPRHEEESFKELRVATSTHGYRLVSNATTQDSESVTWLNQDSPPLTACVDDSNEMEELNASGGSTSRPGIPQIGNGNWIWRPAGSRHNGNWLWRPAGLRQRTWQLGSDADTNRI
jgi:hypothetical protein